MKDAAGLTPPLQAGPLAWGRTLRVQHHRFGLHDRQADLPPEAVSLASGMLPFGYGRSYGDVALNPEGGLLMARGLDRFIDFDPITGVLTCEAGVLLADILSLVAAQGWFLPVTPGTRYVTVGGAIANDVHGKNHHQAGCFTNHILAFELLRSDGSRRVCSKETHAEWFAATAGGLGLTGLVTWVRLQLRRINNPWMLGFQQRFDDLNQFFELTSATDQDYEYSVAWIDCASRGSKLGRGIFMAANHAPAGFSAVNSLKTTGQGQLPFPITPPVSLVNRLSLKAFNALYFHRIAAGRQPLVQHYEPFFYPLDGIRDWNRMYGPEGFHQYQCVVPDGGKTGSSSSSSAKSTVRSLLAAISEHGQGSFLAVLKVCGDIPSPGMLSFPKKGVSLALDFPENGQKLKDLFCVLDGLVANAGGRLYPAKDSRMPGTLFESGYPNLGRFKSFVDPRFSSAFWRRVCGVAGVNDWNDVSKGQE